MHLPTLPKNAAYLLLRNPKKRNALSLNVLQDLKSQLVQAHTSPVSGKLRLLPPFKTRLLNELETAAGKNKSGTEQWGKYGWLINSTEWRKERAGLPDVLVLRSEGSVFSSGHDLKELAQLSHDDVKKLFALCAEVMTLIRQSPSIIVCPIQGLATAAGFQLAMSTDFPIALANTEFCLPGARIGLPCTSPSTAVSRRTAPGVTYRLLATAETKTAAELSDAVDVVPVPEHAESTDTASAAFENRTAAVVERLASLSAQQQAVGKWAYWTQLGIRSSENDEGGEGYESAVSWAGRVMALHARSEDAREGIKAFLEKRNPSWVSRNA